MNILSVVVPSYNSEAYLSHCVGTLLESGEGIEILIVNDGSSDGTAAMANEFEAEYPDRVRAIHQENAGHGGAVNAGIEHATGKYIKVVDSDDWVNPAVLKSIVKRLKGFIDNGEKVDMVLSNFMYDKKGAVHKKIMHYRGIIPENRIVTWEGIGRFKSSKYILMHSVIYSLDVLKKCGLKLPKHTFYVDNLFVYLPLPYVDTMYYIDECLYHYFIGRDEQSVNVDVMIKRIDQQLRVNRLMLEGADVENIKERNKRRYMMHYFRIITTVSTILLIKSGTEEALKMKEDLWAFIKENDPYLYVRIRNSLLGNMVNLPGKTGRRCTMFVYDKVQKRFGFN